MKHPIPNRFDKLVLKRLRAIGYRRLLVGEFRREGDVYADRLGIYSYTLGKEVAAGDFIFRRVIGPRSTRTLRQKSKQLGLSNRQGKSRPLMLRRLSVKGLTKTSPE